MSYTYTYKIETYSKQESRVFVVYTPDNPALEALGHWVSIGAGMTAQQIDDAINSSVPFYKWEQPVNSAVNALLGVVKAGAQIIPEPVVYVPPQLTPQEQAQAMQQAIVNAMTALFDSTAQGKRYDNRITCALRAGYAGPFQAEGQAFAAWMDACNALGYAMLAEVQAGTRPMPSTVEEALALLPPMVWPT